MLLAYQVDSLDRRARILPGLTPYFGVELTASLLILSLKPNMLVGACSVFLDDFTFSKFPALFLFHTFYIFVGVINL